MITFILFEFALGYFVFGLYILLKNRKSLQNRMFFSLCIHLSCWALGDAFMFIAPNQGMANFWRLVAAFGWCFIYTLWLDFAVLLECEDKKWMSSIKRLLIYIPGFVFFIGNLKYDPSWVLIRHNNLWKDRYPLDVFEILYIIYYMFFVIKGLLIIYNWGKKSISKRVKMQSKIIVISASITFVIGAIVDTILPLIGSDIPLIGIMTFPIAIAGIWFAIEKYKMMSITVEIASKYIMDNMNDPVVIIGDEFLIKDANLVALEIVGYGKEEIKGVAIQDFIATTDMNQAAISEFISSGAVKNLEVGLLTRSNKIIPCLVSGSSIYNDLEEFIGIACVFRDITEHKNAQLELENEVAKRTEELKNSNLMLQAEILERKKTEERNQQVAKMEALGTLSGGIAHDFNNILAGIIGYSQLTLEDLDPESDLYDNLLEVLKLGDRAKNLIAQILTFTRRAIVEPAIVDMGIIISEILKMIKTTTSSSVQIKYEFYGNSPFVFANPGEMQQLIMNLCVNAEFAMRDKGGVLQVVMTEIFVAKETKIQFQTIEPGKYVKIQIIDNGCGMKKATVDRIFEPFYTTRGVNEGTGLGLSVVHGIIRSCNGIIIVESEIDKGSNFTVFLPAAKDNLDIKIIEEKTISRSLTRILFVDDEKSIVNTTEKILQREGYIVTGVLGGKNALEIFKVDINFFDIVITDQSMPEMTGSVLVENLRILRPDIPVIMCSGYGHEREEEKIKQLNIQEFLEKPVSKDQYVKAIENVMNK